METTITKELIAHKNDIFRKTFIGGKVLLTSGVNDSDNLQEVIKAVQNFDTFTPDNDPHLERDFGKVTVNSDDYFWKVDYYDDNYEFFKTDGNRVLTIMRADEY